MITNVKNNMHELVFTVVLVLLLLAAGLYSAFYDILEDGLLLEGSTINAVDVSGMDWQRAIESVSEEEQKRMIDTIVLHVTVDDKSAVYTAQDVMASTDAREVLVSVLKEPLAYGGMLSRVDALFTVRKGIEIPISLIYQPKDVYAIAQEFAQQFTVEPVEASLYMDENLNYAYTPDQPGKKLDHGILAKEMLNRLEEGDMSPIQLKTAQVPAPVQESVLRNSVVLMSTVETKLPKDSDAKALLREYAAAINGKAIYPGETFSLLSCFEEAGIELTAQEPTSQLAGTFYNAALLADARVVKREENQRPTEYLPIGLDAAFSAKQDLVLSNSAKFALHIVSFIREGNLVVEIHGQPVRNSPEIRLRSVIDREIDPDPPLFISDSSLKSGAQVLETAAEPGYRVSSYREYFQDDLIVKSELLDLDIYSAVQAIYRKSDK